MVKVPSWILKRSDMPAVSKAQQRFMGMVYATKKGEMKNPSTEVKKAAASIKKKDAKDFAGTKHKGLPNKVESLDIEEESKKCKVGYYYCYTDKKCKPIPKGFKVVGRAGYLRKENGHSQDDDDSKNGGKNGSVSNGNGNGNGGNGNGGGSSGSNGGNGGGVSEGWSDKYKKSIDCDNPKGFSQKAHCQGKKKKMNEESNPRIPRKKGQPANSKKHSDLYTDENPKGTIHGLGFKDVASAKASVSKIRNSSRSHAHKIQAAVAMEQRAREMGKSSEAAVYRKYINSMKKKTKEKNESYDANDYNTLKDKVGSAKKHRKTFQQFMDRAKS
jgi:hypothetical protein